MALFAAFAVLAALALLFVLFSKWRYQYWTRKGMPQLEPQFIVGDLKPIVDRSVSLQVHFLNIYKKAKAKELKNIGIYSFLSPQWMPLDLNVIKCILLRDFEYFPGQGFYKHEKEPFTQNLLFTEGEHWKQLRVKLTPTFTTGKMKMMFDTLAEKTDILNKKVGELAQHDKPLETKEILSRFGTDVIGSVGFGIECNSLEEEVNKFREVGKDAVKPDLLKFIMENLLPHKLLGNLGYRAFSRKTTEYFTDVVKATIRYRENNGIERKDFMQLLMQLKNQKDKALTMTEDEIASESFLFYGAGFETSSNAATWALLELARHQDVQDKLRQEIHEVLEKNNGKFTYDALMEMKYLEQVIHESLRRYPPPAFLPRLCAKNYKIPGTDIVIEKGTMVIIPSWGIQMDPEYYPNPEEFNPENFSPENKSKRPDYTWMPFGEGPKQCIGLRFGMMESRMAIAALIKDYKFTPHEKTPWPFEFEKGSPVVTVQGGGFLRVHKL